MQKNNADGGTSKISIILENIKNGNRLSLPKETVAVFTCQLYMPFAFI